jgi:hypothetical protein
MVGAQARPTDNADYLFFIPFCVYVLFFSLQMSEALTALICF